MSMPAQLASVFELLLARYGQRHWWPAETPFEVCVGAILTQNTAWTNVEKAIVNLKAEALLSPEALRYFGTAELARSIRPAGYFNIKAQRLKEFVCWLFAHHGGSLERMFTGEWQQLREQLLQVKGIGRETADSILLYAGAKPTFVVDAYTRRIFSRLGILPSDEAPYEEVRTLCMTSLPADVPLYNEYHALIVEHAKVHCRSIPRCGGCPLAEAPINCPSRNGGMLATTNA
jgi:endonuclease III related protein